MRGKTQQCLLNELFSTSKHICLICFCPEEALCHRSIIGGMLQGAGLEVKGLSRDYSYYFDWYKNGVPGAANGFDIQDPVEDEKPITDYRKDVTFLYRLDISGKQIFKDDIPTMCFTGRRPKDLCGYDVTKYSEFVSDLVKLLYEEFYQKRNIRRFISGAAQGFDQLAFWAVERMKKLYGCKDVQNIVFVAFEHQEIRWAKSGCFSQAEYGLMLRQADQVMVVCNDNTIESLFTRNHAMCDCSDCCLGLYPDDTWRYSRGGTAECLRYAVRQSMEVLCLNYVINDMGLHVGKLTETEKE